ncbi:MAG: TonB-dependent receptor [Lentimicrobiaceae bacterium]|nr:TonB-dependent receptor [Lentimicrobiaceae bacterium]
MFSRISASSTALWPTIILLFLLIQLACVGAASAQLSGKAEIYGKITDEQQQPLALVNIAIVGMPGGAVTGADGTFVLKVDANTELNIVISSVGYSTIKLKIVLKEGEKRELNRRLIQTAVELPDFVVEDRQVRSSSLSPINPRLATQIPSTSGGIEALIKTMPGVSSNTELSSQYSVRGGNYDENLVYVNDVEIYKPFLVRSGQQEGLSFLNPDLVSSILFSAGGFDARYGDKMSSVLDIRYKRPTTFGGSVSASLLGASLHLEGSTKDRRFMYLVGARQKNSQYVLKGLETEGDYIPSFTDFQGMLHYEVNPRLEFSVFGNYALNNYKLEPTVRNTSFGTINEALQLTVYFDGHEVDRFENYMGAFTTSYKASEQLMLKFIVSAFQTIESETFDIMGQYWIGELETDLGSQAFGQALHLRDVGSYLNHARNYLDATVKSVEQRGTLVKENATTLWGIKYQREVIHDRMSEWNLNDSAGFTLPYHAGVPGEPGNQSEVMLQDVVRSKTLLESNRLSGFLQQHFTFTREKSQYGLTVGARVSYWDVNRQWLVSPRGTISFKPASNRDILYRVSAGRYVQPPFYREMRAPDGQVNTNLKAQTSTHLVAGTDLNFMAWGRPFKFTAEAYYKFLRNLVPYDVDNVRLRYYAKNMASGYATGLDFKVNGEFVKGVESWASLSLMRTAENLDEDSYTDYFNASGERIIAGFTSDAVIVDSLTVYRGFMPRPTDQLITFGLFFQDYLPRSPTYKMHLNLLFGTGMPYSPPGDARARNAQRMPPFRRVDIGFSKQIIGNSDKTASRSALLKHVRNIWISAEVLNLLQVKNTISYMWIKDVNNRQYGVPNYLTPRQLNIKLSIEF